MFTQEERVRIGGYVEDGNMRQVRRIITTKLQELQMKDPMWFEEQYNTEYPVTKVQILHANLYVYDNLNDKMRSGKTVGKHVLDTIKMC